MSAERLTRREWLGRGAGAVLAAGASVVAGYWLHDAGGKAGAPGSRGGESGSVPRLPLKNYLDGIDFPPRNPRISIATGQIERIDQLVRAAAAGLDAQLGMRRFIRPGDVVLIKPNAGFDRPPQLGATTHPEVLRCVIRLCREAGARQVLITDNPIEAPEACFARSGLAAVAAAEGARIVSPCTADFAPLDATSAGAGAAGRGLLDRWPIFAAPLRRATRLIGIAPVKDHNLCSASMSLKNWYGLLGGPRNRLHQSIHQTIGELGALFSPTLVFADATRVMMHNGPTGGRESDVSPGGLLGRPAVVAAVDPVACDAWCYEKLLGRNTNDLKYLELAAERIAAQVAAGQRGFGQRDWQIYERAGQLISTDL